MAGEGLLEGKSDSADRRKSVLSVTEKALPIVARGQELQKKVRRATFAPNFIAVSSRRLSVLARSKAKTPAGRSRMRPPRRGFSL